MRNFPSASSRENPSAVCVRSFVPKEKKSACSAISSARTHARGSSIIVPQRYSSSPSSSATRSVSSRRRRELFLEADERMHHLDERRVAGSLATASPARMIARTCIS